MVKKKVERWRFMDFSNEIEAQKKNYFESLGKSKIIENVSFRWFFSLR